MLLAILRAIITGIAMFFPGFILSLPLTVLWARRQFAGEAQAPLAGIAVIFYIGLLSGIAGLVYKLIVGIKEQRVKER